MKKLLLLLLFSASIFANIGTIMVVKGNASVKRAHKTLHARNGMTLLKGDKIITQKRTRVQVMLNDDTTITIGPHSSFSFLKYFFDGTKKSTIKMQSNRGFFRSVTGKIGKVAPERFKVKTSLATIGIRGTDFSVQQGNGISSYICNRGEITLKYGKLKKSIIAGDSVLLHLQGSIIKEIGNASMKKSKQAKKILKKHALQIGVKPSRLIDVPDHKIDTPKIRFNCDTN